MLTIIAVAVISPPEGVGDVCWFIVALLVAPVAVFWGVILSILDILGLLYIKEFTYTTNILFLSSIILIIFWVALDDRKISNRLKAIRNRLKEIEEIMPKYIPNAKKANFLRSDLEGRINLK